MLSFVQRRRPVRNGPPHPPTPRAAGRAPVAGWLLLLVVALAAAPAAAAPPTFDPPALVTDGTRKHRLAQNPARAALWEGETLHLAWWSGGFATSLAEPSFVFHRAWTSAAGWGATTTVDDSFDAQQRRLGGRHPTLHLLR